MPRFIIKKRVNGEYMFNLLACNGQVILTSEGYETLEGCKSGILSVQANSHLHGRYERRQSSDGQHYFVPRASNGKIIGTSEPFRTPAAMMADIESALENGEAQEW